MINTSCVYSQVSYLSFSILLEGTCSDTANGATDTGRDGCDWYNDKPQECGKYDDDDFVANSVCCACGGILPVNPIIFMWIIDE